MRAGNICCVKRKKISREVSVVVVSCYPFSLYLRLTMYVSGHPICPHLENECMIYNGNRTEWSPIWSVIIRVMTNHKSDDRVAGVRFV